MASRTPPAIKDICWEGQHWERMVEPPNEVRQEKETGEDGASSPLPKSSAQPSSGGIKPTPGCIAHIQHNLNHLYKEPLDGIFVCPDEDRADTCYAILVGPSDTPYEWGFFLFHMDFPFDYPFNPPKVTFITTGGGQVRFNPNLYNDGTVCLSILGTWHGPSWSPAQSIGSVLLSIRSLLNENPYHNEPGYEESRHPNGPKSFNQVVRHETLRVAVLEMVELAVYHDPTLPGMLKAPVCSMFLDNVELYKYYCDEFMFLDGKRFQDPFGWNSGTFRFATIKQRLETMEEIVRDMTSKEVVV